MALRETIEKLEAALAKANKRIQAREGDEKAAEGHVRGLNRQIRDLREDGVTPEEKVIIERKVSARVRWRLKARRARKRSAWWVRRRTSLRVKLKEAQEKWEKEHRLDFESWMLNGCAGNVSDDIKKIIAYVVVVCDQYVTSTTGGTHAPGSYHYSGRGVDWGAGSVSSMQNAANKTRAHFGESYFTEFFSPCPWWIKYGAVYSGYFPGHGDHGHCAV